MKRKKAEAFEVESGWIKTPYFRFSRNLREKLAEQIPCTYAEVIYS